MNYIEKFRQGRKITKAELGTDTSKFATYTQSGNTRTYTPNTFNYSADDINNILSQYNNWGPNNDMTWEQFQAYTRDPYNENKIKEKVNEPFPELYSIPSPNNQTETSVNPTVETPAQPTAPVVTPRPMGKDWNTLNSQRLKRFNLSINPTDQKQVKQVQQYLINAGYDIGSVDPDGKVGNKTLEALDLASKAGQLTKSGFVRSYNTKGRLNTSGNYTPTTTETISLNGTPTKMLTYTDNNGNKKGVVADGKDYTEYSIKQNKKTYTKHNWDIGKVNGTYNVDSATTRMLNRAKPGTRIITNGGREFYIHTNGTAYWYDPQSNKFRLVKKAR